VAALAVAQTMDPPVTVIDDDDDQTLAGQAELLTLAPPPLELGADLGNACVCHCRQAETPRTSRWGYYERSIVTGCQWSGRVCVVEGMLGSIGACTESAAPLN